MSYLRTDYDGKNSVVAIFEKILKYDEFLVIREYLPDGEITIEFLFRIDQKIKAGRQVLGACYIPSVQGELKSLFDWMLEKEFGYIPDFLIVLDFDYWDQASKLQREILIFHELSHIGQAVDKFDCPRFDKNTGRPVWRIVGHDVEEFEKVIARYGAHDIGLSRFFDALLSQKVNEN